MIRGKGKMSGIDAIRGFDYQVSYTLFLVVSLIAKNNNENFKS